MLMDGLCLVVTPLIALMQDQVLNLKAKGIKATAIYTGLTASEIQIRFENCLFGDYKFLYVSPERLQSETFRKQLLKLKVCLLAIDEAHCISQWGYDFRPQYLQIASIRKQLPDVPVLALTATATTEVVADIQKQLSFKSSQVFRASFYRANLSYVVRHTDDKLKQLLNILAGVQGSSIVYVRTRDRAKQVAQMLLDNNISASYYHAGLLRQEKQQRLEKWKQYPKTPDSIRVMVCTNAFGMGIDKPDVRTVVHWDTPDSAEAYFQEAGRVGRDGKKSYAVLLFDNKDEQKMRNRVSDTYPDENFIKQVYQSLSDYYEIGIGSGLNHTFAFHLEQFCTEAHLPFVPTLSAIGLLSQAGYLNYVEETETNPRICFTITKEEFYHHSFSDLQDRLLNLIMRYYTGVFSDFVYINDYRLSTELSIPERELNYQLVLLSREGVLRYIPRAKTPYVNYPTERVDIHDIRLPEFIVKTRKQQYADRLEFMIKYATEDDICRSRLLQEYFAETGVKDCGVCDVCLKKRTNL
ncbi:MAG: RecQ family ATP-dependent DNA helicase [Paludibacteraceae bacterium]|nr:RecQ family ATP-dependent DNA helicase [Paludibacteraceae bacterium]